MKDLHAVLFTHFHVDHAADFPVLVKSSFFEDRTPPLPVFGPAGSSLFPSTTEFIKGPTVFANDLDCYPLPRNP